MDATNHQPPTVFLAGPTGVGKSEFAIEFASRINGEIVGADAFQVYSELPILTAQPGCQRRGIAHHRIGHVPVSEVYNVQRYCLDAVRSIEEISRREKIPVVVGGTGLYFRGLIQGLDPAPASNSELRHELEQLSLSVLLERLYKVDPSAAEQIDVSNPRRVIRAIEICELSGGKPLKTFRRRKHKISAQSAWLLLRDREELHQRIEANVSRMWLQGVIQEIAEVRDKVGETASQAIGFREITALLDGKLTESQCRQAICLGTRRYAKRQLTWFRNQTTFTPLNLSLFSSTSAAVEALLTSGIASSTTSSSTPAVPPALSGPKQQGSSFS